MQEGSHHHHFSPPSLLQWSNSQVSAARKEHLYQHIFSYASVKTVVQWFQLIKLRRLAFYADDTNRNR